VTVVQTSSLPISLQPDAGDAAIEGLAARLLPVVLKGREKHPWSKEPAADAPGGAKNAERTMAEAMAQLYDPAQLRVLKRLPALLEEAEAAAADAGGDLPCRGAPSVRRARTGTARVLLARRIPGNGAPSGRAAKRPPCRRVSARSTTAGPRRLRRVQGLRYRP